MDDLDMHSGTIFTKSVWRLNELHRYDLCPHVTKPFLQRLSRQHPSSKSV